MTQPIRPQMTMKYGADRTRFSCLLTKARIQAHTRGT